ncbi:MAG: short chain dehydrogenase [Ferrovum sp. 37-45-19]|uniref:SDR family oxidoreductase n=1 Tax=Ferrovum sp. JA12 TaxID=1356299 RepID=UPI0007163933|nr:SDR family oxidoreductase [Ferrovum sp. JA12]OYV78921.1 MAG: short chain dehydrogenase [Ferrovum sp. 21-44-67]OYV94914.1 MAG: short chain dehydrogenase [Ferrovum sp. 37-45-19]OZB32516.1 MAG: short chain dehydrogenase [Ferrovum sp. 34-44-207]HQT82295.1 SDR family oxidoreductase [Ferrovaceae bacterium]KRH79328.1 enoyl-[acyl-carrier-protein] reductase [NADPH] FabL [Ferrovum sp. JA12]
MTDNRPIALITGAGKRIGKAIALTLANHGWDIAIHYNQSKNEASSVQSLIQNMGRRAITLSCDLGDMAQVTTLCQEVKTHLGHPMLLVNNASLFEYDNPDHIDMALFDWHMAINVKAALILSESFFHLQKEINRQGLIVNLLDQKLINPNPDYFSYTLSKAALSAAIPLMAQHYAPHVRVMGIAPGIILPSGPQLTSHFEQIQQLNPLQKAATPEDIAKTVLYLTEVNSLTGSTIFVDAGQHLVTSTRDVMFIDPSQISH